ncbi:hypothetical protein AVEN_246272-1 [Araneus ventricosus]|uniref:Uncharacterized protein n=1 Tax=Araneus ventricosus TaxID=182803 RepID=A0A4Y2Q6R5_ARAVE|nr:hypothetical protein AVEN_246272-1 [Araneus ventricosus]
MEDPLCNEMRKQLSRNEDIDAKPLTTQGRGGLVVRGFPVRNQIPLKLRRVWGCCAKSCVVDKRPRPGGMQKLPHWPGPPKKDIRPGEDQQGESRLPACGERDLLDTIKKVYRHFSNRDSTFKYQRAGSISMVRSNTVGKE